LGELSKLFTPFTLFSANFAPLNIEIFKKKYTCLLMGTNLLDLVKGQLTDALLSKAAGFLGEDYFQGNEPYFAFSPRRHGK
jgi:hypothetical protein